MSKVYGPGGTQVHEKCQEQKNRRHIRKNKCQGTKRTGNKQVCCLTKINMMSTIGQEKGERLNSELLGFPIRKWASVVKKEGRAYIGGDTHAPVLLNSGPQVPLMES